MARRPRVTARRNRRRRFAHLGSCADYRLGRWMSLGLEWLEPRRLLTGSPVIISEVQAGNSSGIVTAGGVASDWLEITNTSSNQNVNLANWQLRYNTAPTVWTFPSMNLGPGESRVIFCDSASATDPSQELHTNFNLSKSGKNLLLVDNLGNTVSSYTPYPAMQTDTSYGVGETVSETDLVAAGVTARYFAPTNGTLGTTWTQPSFVDSSWASGPTGLGYAVVNGWASTLYKANTGSVATLAQANAVISTPSQQSYTYSQTSATLNYMDTGGGGHFANDTGFPGMIVNQGLSYYAVQATGTITITQSGFYTFGVNSDDGFSMTIGGGVGLKNGVNTTSISGGTMNCDRLQGPTDTFATTTASLAAGTYPVTVTFFQNAGGSSLEVFAAKAPTSSGYSSYNTNFHLIGDTAGGGLAITSTPFAGNGTSSKSPIAAAIKTNVKTTLQNAIQAAGGLTSLYTRITFNAANLASLTSLTLKMQYGSGYVAYLNGVQVASANAPASPTWNSAALSFRNSPVQTTTYENVDLSSFLNSGTTGHLNATGNVLAIQTLLRTTTDADVFVSPALGQMSIAPAGLHFFAKPTPGLPNTSDTWQPDLTFSKQHGFYDAPFQLTLTTSTPGATIYYTTDNSTPSATHGTVYTTPINITTTTDVRAVSVVAGGQAGVVSTESYIFLAAVLNQPSTPAGFPTLWGVDTNGNPQQSNYAMNPQITQNPLYAAGLKQAMLSLPSVSIVTDVSKMFDATQSASANTGIYTNEQNLVQTNGISLTAASSVEYFDPNSSDTFQINAGVQMQGGVGRYPQFQKHNFRVEFSSDFGPTKLDYPLFPGDPVTSFDNLVLKAGFNDAWAWTGSGSPPGNTSQYMRDLFAANSLLAMGQPDIHSKYVFLYIDGLFWGVYMMMERPDANFAASYLGGDGTQWEANNAGHEVDGSASNLPYWNMLQSFPNSNTMTTLAAYEKVQGNNPDGTPNASYTDLLDMTNYIDYMLMNFYVGNTDWPWHNFYAAIDTATPTGFKFFSWDAEMSLGLINGGFNSNLNVNVLGPSFSGGNGVGTLYSAMYSNPEFEIAFADQARQFLFNNGALTPSATIARYQSMVNTISAAIVAESARWGTIPTSPGPLPNTQAAWLNEANWITGTYMPQRTGILVSQLQAAGLYPNIAAPDYSINGTNEYGGTFNPNDLLTISTSNLPAGAVIYYTLDGTDPRLLGGAVNTSASVHVYSGPIALAQGTTVKARIYSGGVWSALSNATFTVNLQSVRITELMYNPLPATASEIAAGYASVDGAQDFEYIEVKNTGSQTLPLAGLQFTSGVTFAFPSVSIAPGAFMVVTSDSAAFALRYGAQLQAIYGSNWQSLIVAGQYTGHLNNGGEEVQLTAPNGGVLQDFTYNNTWYSQTDGGGFSLTIRDPSQPDAVSDTSSGWQPSGSPGGTPGAAETNPIPLPGSVKINEVLANPATPGGDMIELINSTAQPINVGGWWLSDNSSTRTKYQIAAGTVIAAGGFLVLTDAHNYGAGSGDPGALTPFSLSKYGFTVALSSNAGGMAGGYQVQQSFGATPAGASAGRYANSTGDSSFILLSAPTFGAGPNFSGAANTAIPYVSPVVMSELEYDPSPPSAAETAAGFTDGDQFEFIELTNRSGTPQSLANDYLGNGIGFSYGWLADGVPGQKWTLESGATSTWSTNALAAGTYTVTANFNLTDQNGTLRTGDTAAQYVLTYPGGTQTVTINQNTAVGGKLTLGTINVTGPGTVQVQLTRGASAAPSELTLANQVEFVKTGVDLVVSNPVQTSFATQIGLGTLAPGASVVLVSNYAAFDFRYHIAANHIPVAGVYTGQQNDGGETLALFQVGAPDPVTGYIPSFQTDIVQYDNNAPWPSEAGGQGPALIRLRLADYANDPNNWMASNEAGTPGTANLALDRLPPTVPSNVVAASAVSPNRINLAWTASVDPRSNVDHYNVYRNGLLLGTSLTTAYSDTTIQTATNYSYAVTAVNRDGYESGQSVAVNAALAGVKSYGWIDSQHLEIYFNEPLTTGPATTLSNYSMTGGITFASVVLSRANTKITLTTNQAVVANTSYTLTMNNLTTVSGNQLPASQQLMFTYQNPTGSILLQFWGNLDGANTVADLTNPALNPNYPNNPTSSSLVNLFEAPFNTGQVDYGQRIIGYIYPPTTGSYVFWIASDDNSELWLSTDANPNNAVRIATVPGSTGYRQWTAYSTQQSTAINLVAGQRYFIMALQKQGAGADNLSVAWQPPGTTFNTSTGTPIPGQYLAPFGGNMDLTPPAAPANVRATITGSNNQIALAWSPVVDLSSGIDHYAIYRDSQAYATSTTPSFLDSNNISSQIRHTYQVAAVNYDGITGPLSAALAVAPVGIAGIATPSTTSVSIVFSEPVSAATAQVASNYQISGVTVSSATLQADGVTVLLATSALGGSSHSLVINNIQTRAGAALPTFNGMVTYVSSGWAITVYEGNGNVSSITSLAAAQSLVNTPANQAWVRTAAPPTINYATGEGGFLGNYQNDAGLPGQLPTDNVYNYAMTATGQIYIPAAGTYTFDCTSDDGFSVTITGATFTSGTNVTSLGGNSFAYDGSRGTGDSFGVATFPTAGYYPLSLLFFQGGGPSSVELSAAAGAQTAFNAGLFHLVGDLASGGLALGGTAAPAPFTITVPALATNDPSPPVSGTTTSTTATVTIRVNGVYYAAANFNGAWAVPDGAIQALANGTYDVLASASNSSGQAAYDTTTGELLVNTSGPTTTVVPVVSPRKTALDSLAIQFSAPVSGFSIQNVQLTYNGLSAPLAGATLTSADGQNWTLGNLTGLDWADGTYQFTVNPQGWGVTDSSGNPMTAAAVGSWVMSAGTLQGNASNNVYRIVTDPGDSSKADVYVNNSTNTPTYIASLAGFSQWTLNAQPGDQLIVDFSGGNPLPGGGFAYNGAAGNALTIVGTSANDVVVASPTLITVNGAPPISYGNLASFQFNLGAGQDTLTVNGASMHFTQASAISSGTALVVDGGGTVDLGGFTDTVRSETLVNGQIVNGVLMSSSHTVESGIVGATLGGTGDLTKTGGGSTMLTAINIYTGTTAVNGGSLVLDAMSGMPNVAAGATVAVSNAATLELAGIVSTLGIAGGHRAAILNNSSAAAGLLVSGHNQIVGAIGGSGNTVINAGSDLTADSIVQGSLVIGGTAGSPSVFTLAASDDNGNPLAAAAATIDSSAETAVGNAMAAATNAPASDDSTIFVVSTPLSAAPPPEPGNRIASRRITLAPTADLPRLDAGLSELSIRDASPSNPQAALFVERPPLAALDAAFASDFDSVQESTDWSSRSTQHVGDHQSSDASLSDDFFDLIGR